MLVELTILCYIFIVYVNESKKYPMMFSDKKSIIIVVMITIIFQIILRIIYWCLELFGIFKKLANYRFYFAITIIFYLVLTDVLSITIYTIYLKKDTDCLIIIMSEEVSDYGSFCSASILEQYFLKSNAFKEKTSLSSFI